MGLTVKSMGSQIFSKENKQKYQYQIAIAGNPNVGKSTIFNALTGMKQHTGNWPGKTVENTTGICTFHKDNYLLVDIPGTYSLMSNSEEEEIARNYLCFTSIDATVVIVDATCLERSLNLVEQIMEITPNVIVCVNLLDEAKKKKIEINLKQLENLLEVPVVGTIDKKKNTLNTLMQTIEKTVKAEQKQRANVIQYSQEIEEVILNIQNKLVYDDSQTNLQKRWCALKILDGDEKIIQTIEEKKQIKIRNNEQLQTYLQNLRKEKKFQKQYMRDEIIRTVVKQTEKIAKEVVTFHKENYQNKGRKIDKIITSKIWGIPIMLVFLAIILWITIVGANYPSQALSMFFEKIQEYLKTWANAWAIPTWLQGIAIDGIYQTATWIIAVMLPPMAIFFPLFTLLEDLGVLPRIAFNLDKCFRKVCSSGKQALTMCMGLGCNAAGVIGAKIMDTPKEKLLAIVTNSFMPCNGRFPFLITISTIFIGGYVTNGLQSIVAAIAVLAIILLGIAFTFIISKILSKTIIKGNSSHFILELPPYRKPQIGKILIRSILDRTLFVLGRAIAVAAPAGAVIWLLANIMIGDSSILSFIANFLDPFAKLTGLDGYILTAFILGLPANEIVLPIILMSYLGKGTLVSLENSYTIGEILIQNGWTILTALNVMLFTLLHFPCSTTLLTIKKETGKWRWSILAFLMPTICGIVICMLTTAIYHIIV